MADLIGAPESPAAPLALFTEEDIRTRVRYDPETRRFSLIDVVGLACGVNKDNATSRLTYLLSTDEEVRDPFTDCSEPPLSSKITYFKFPGERQRETPVADFTTCCEVISMLGGRRAAMFRRTAMATFARALAGDMTLAAQIERTSNLIAGTPLQEALLEGTGVDAPAPAALTRAEALALEDREMHVRWNALELETRALANAKEAQEHASRQIELIRSVQSLAAELSVPELSRLQRYLDRVIVPPPPTSEPLELPIRKAKEAERKKRNLHLGYYFKTTADADEFDRLTSLGVLYDVAAASVGGLRQ